MSAPISACLLARDEEAQLPACLDTLAFVDEIVAVVDARSRDRSEQILRARADVCEVRPYAGDVDQKRYCSGLASHDWVLIVDPDERITRRAAESIRRAVDAADAQDAGFELDRVTWHLGRWVRHGDFHPDWKLRLYRRSRARWVGLDPHGRVEVSGRVQRLAGEIEHYSYRDLSDQIARIRRFSEQAAAAMDAAGRRARLSDLVLRPPARFLRAYVLKRGFLDGVPGLVIAAATAFHVFLKYALLWERQHVERHG